MFIALQIPNKYFLRYFHALFSNEELLHRYYEDWSLFCDQEKNSMLPNMAAGIKFVTSSVRK